MQDWRRTHPVRTRIAPITTNAAIITRNRNMTAFRSIMASGVMPCSRLNSFQCFRGVSQRAYTPYAIKTGVGNIEDIAGFTGKDRVLLYLSDFTKMEDRYELPKELIQESISNATAIQRKHLPQYLKDLIGEGLVVQRKAHVKGMKQRMNVYYLSSDGRERSADMRTRLNSLIVPVRNGDMTVDMRMDEIDEATPARITLCDIVTQAVVQGCLDIGALERIESGRFESSRAEDEATQSYKRALRTAWRDGKVTATERFLIDELRSLLRISESEHQVIEEEILKALAQDRMEFMRIYRKVLEIAMEDGSVEGPEVEILKSLRRMLRISQEEHAGMLEELKMEFFGPEGAA